MILKKYSKDPASTNIDYVFDFASLRNGSGYKDYLGYGETITSATVTSSSNDLIINQTSIIKNDTAVQVWLSGGVLGATYTLTAHIITSDNGRNDYRSISIFMEKL
jgi:hypothetical protein